MGHFRYVTNRTLANKQGQEAGKIRVIVKNDSDQLEGDYTCPECTKSGKVHQLFKRPITVRCESCKATMKLPRLKGKKK